MTTIFLSLGYLISLHTPSPKQESAPSPGSASACIDINGRVLGDITPNATVSLYETPSLNYSVVMKTIRTFQPINHATVNASGEFIFGCLYPGQYVFAIPSSSYNSSVGSPLPYESNSKNLSLRIVFQGGDYYYLVGAFSIEDISVQNKSATTNFYKRGSLDLN